jgi:glycosyltransferase involved in cell wall biosynthesis
VSERLPVSVIVPFRGDRADAHALLDGLGELRVAPGDQVIVADNGKQGTLPRDDSVDIVPVAGRPSARRARNEGARRSGNPWLLFLDADCRPDPSLLDLYLSPEPGGRCGVMAGEVAGDESQRGVLARWARSRRGLMARHHVEGRGRPAGIAGNLMVRREAWERAGGFEEEARSEADVDLCWRIQEEGWTLEYRPEALVAHRDPERLGGVLRQAWGYGAGKRWLRRRWGDAAEPPRILVPLARAVGGTLVWTLTLRFERALFKLIDGLVAAAGWFGYQAARLRR